VYTAPETFGTGTYSQASEVYAWAVLAWEVMMGEVAWKDIPPRMLMIRLPMLVFSDGKRPEIPSALANTGLAQLVVRCWVQDEAERLSFAQLEPLLASVSTKTMPEIEQKMRHVALTIGGFPNPPDDPAANRFNAAPQEMVFGEAIEAVRGIEDLLCVDVDVVHDLAREGIEAIRKEFAAHPDLSNARAGITHDDVLECVSYVLDEEAGSSKKAFQHGRIRDCTKSGELLPDRLVGEPPRGMKLADFVSHPWSQAAKLSDAEMAALRLYTTAAYHALNEGLRDQQRHLERRAHPLPMTVYHLRRGVMKLRAVEVQQDTANKPMVLYRGLCAQQLMAEFRRDGGTELAPCSTTSDLAVAMQYAASRSAVLLYMDTKSFIDRGADLTFLSCFPQEAEVLFPPLTFFKPKGEPLTIEIDEAKFLTVEVEPRIGGV
jgi:hypothetical protein